MTPISGVAVVGDDLPILVWEEQPRFATRAMLKDLAELTASITILLTHENHEKQY